MGAAVWISEAKVSRGCPVKDKGTAGRLVEARVTGGWLIEANETISRLLE